jgi:uncharacterized protein (DUF3820 family)
MMDDNSKMPFGKHVGVKMANVPPDYLIWLYDNNKCGKELKTYIENNMDVLKSEIITNNKNKNK